MSYEEQIMSKDKDPSIFSPQMSLLLFKTFSQCAQFSKLGNILGYSPVLAGEYSVTRLA